MVAGLVPVAGVQEGASSPRLQATWVRWVGEGKVLLCGRRERGREARCVSVFSSSTAPISTGETDGFIVALEEREGGKRGRQAVALLVRWGGRGQLLLLLSLVLLQDYTFLLVHCLHVVPQSSPLGTSVRTKITNMRLCPVVNVHVIVETSSLSERLLTMVATVRPFTTVDPLVSPGGKKECFISCF